MFIFAKSFPRKKPNSPDSFCFPENLREKNSKFCETAQVFLAAAHMCFCLTHIFAKAFGDTNIFANVKIDFRENATTKTFISTLSRDDPPEVNVTFVFSILVSKNKGQEYKVFQA
jgi:hypothetical protein